jgi:PAS domain S-box-containing protein
VRFEVDENRTNTNMASDNPEKNIDNIRQRIRLLYEQSPFAYQSLDKDGFIREVNSSWLDMFGYSRQEVIGRWIGDFLTGKSKEKFKRRFPKFLSSGRMTASVFELVCKDGKIIAVEVDGKIGTDKDGHFQQTHCIMRDITKQKEAEDKLRLLSSIVHQCREGIAVSDLNGNLMFMNYAFAQMHGYEPSELFGKNFSILRLAEYTNELETILDTMKKKGEFKGRVIHIKKDGSVFPLLMHISRLFDDSKEIVGNIVIILDISELQQKEDELRRERDLAQKYLDIAGVILIAIGSDRKVQMINKKGCSILGYDQKDIIGRDWFENFIELQERDRVSSGFDLLMEGKIESVEYFENNILTRNGEVKTIAWHNTILKDEKGQITGTLSSGLDIAEQKKSSDGLNR